MDKPRDPAQVRDAILKVFRALTSSPKRGPAIVVGRRTPTISKTGGVKTATETFHKYRLYDSDDVMISNGTCTPEKQIPKPTKDSKKTQNAAKPHQEDETRKDHCHLRTSRHKIQYQKEKRRKSKAERNKNRAHRKQQQVDRHGRAEFRKHVKRAKEISSHSRIDRALRDSSQAFSVITQSRLTRPVGIYNHGKKSDKVYRAPIHVPDRVQEAVEKGLKEILSSSTTTLHCAPSYESLLIDRGATPVFSTNKWKGPTPPVRSATRSHSSLITVDLTTEATTKDLPKDPPFEEIAAELLASLDVKMMFHDRDYFEEVQEELLKLMKQNRVSGEGDHSNVTSHTSRLDAFLTRNAEKNNQEMHSPLFMESHPHEVSQTYIPDSHNEPGPRPEPPLGPHPGDAVYSLSQNHQEHRSQAGFYHGPHLGPHPEDAVYSLSQESDGLDLRQLQYHQEARTTQFASTEPSVSYHTAYMPDSHKRALHTITDGMELLTRAEEIRKSNWGNDRCSGYRQEHSEPSSNDILDIITSAHHQPLSSQPHPGDSLPQFGSSYPWDKIHGLSYNPAPNHLDDGSCRSSRHHFHDDCSWVFERDHQATTEQYLREEFKVHGYSRPDKELLWRRWNGQWKRGRDSDDDSPVWYPTYVSPLRKPKMESPSPPKQYPQRMY